MNDPTVNLLPSDRSEVTDAVRAQILATEHWSLLATRTITWNEIFSRATMYITVLSAAVVALALVAQVTNFGSGFSLFRISGSSGRPLNWIYDVHPIGRSEYRRHSLGDRHEPTSARIFGLSAGIGTLFHNGSPRRSGEYSAIIQIGIPTSS